MNGPRIGIIIGIRIGITIGIIIGTVFGTNSVFGIIIGAAGETNRIQTRLPLGVRGFMSFVLCLDKSVGLTVRLTVRLTVGIVVKFTVESVSTVVFTTAAV